MKKDLYLDIDDTYLDTEIYLRRVIKANGMKLGKNESVYSKLYTPWYSDLLKMLMSDYSVIPKKYGADECLKLIETEYNVILCSSCFNVLEREAKKEFARVNHKEIILCEDNKSHVDMSEATFVDDRIIHLNNSNATVKYAMYNKYNLISSSELEEFDKFKGILLYDWFSLMDFLLGGEEDAELREYICQRVPKLCQGHSRV